MTPSSFNLEQQTKLSNDVYSLIQTISVPIYQVLTSQNATQLN